MNGACLSDVPNRLNDTELSQEEFRDNICLRYGMVPQDIPATCNGCGKKLLIEHALLCPKSGLILVQHDDTTKELGALRARDLVPIAITYKPKSNIRTVQGKRTRSGVRQKRGTAGGGADTEVESQGGRGKTVYSVDRLVGRPGQIELPSESRADVSAHGFWKRVPL